MKNASFSIPTSLGEIINIKGHLDYIKSQYGQIRLSFGRFMWQSALHTEASDWRQKEVLWNKYLSDIGTLFFTEPPYVVDNGSYTFHDTPSLVRAIGLNPMKVELGHLLCKGNSLNLGEEYIVITTKIRYVEKYNFFPVSGKLWNTLKKLSQKYKIVILGEREVEMRREYDNNKSDIFGLYEQMIVNLPNDRIVDLTVPALGETVADLSKIQQDCLIMKEAKFVITVGVGGNFCMSTAVSNMAIGYRTDNLNFTNAIYHGKEYPNAIITKDWARFIRALESYL